MKYSTDAASRDVDLQSDVAEFLQRFIGNKKRRLLAIRNGTSHLHNNIEERLADGAAQENGVR